jgi:preprotein translocase subunit SecA
MLSQLNRDTVSFLCRGQIGVEEPEKVKEARERSESQDMGQLKTGREDASGILDPQQAGKQAADAQAQAQAQAVQQSQQQQQVTEPIRKGEKVGRNDPCPCGSGKKYKKCHGKPT